MSHFHMPNMRQFFTSVHDRMKSCYLTVTEHVRRDTLGFRNWKSAPNFSSYREKKPEVLKKQDFGSSVHSPETETEFSVLSRTSRDYFIILFFLYSRWSAQMNQRGTCLSFQVSAAERGRESSRGNIFLTRTSVSSRAAGHRLCIQSQLDESRYQVDPASMSERERARRSDRLLMLI